MNDLFLESLHVGPLLCDGAMGTMLYERAPEGKMHGRCFEELVLTDPELVQQVHHEYIRAGAQVIETNTFGANAAKLEIYGLSGHMKEINRRAAQLAREAREVAGQTVFVAGAVGPSGQFIMPTSSDDEPRLVALRRLFREQIEALMEGGVELLILETFSSLQELRQAVQAAREIGGLPIVAQMSFTEDGQSISGDTPADAALALAALDVDVIGINCGIGPAGTLDAIQEIASALRTLSSGNAQHIFLSAQPNAGLPMRVENRLLYRSTPHYFANYARQFVAAGVRLIGACCGTTPSHITAMREAMADLLPVPLTSPWPTETASAARPPIMKVHQSAPEISTDSASAPLTRLQQELDTGHFVVSVELDPPKGLNPSKILDGAAYLKDMGVQFINIADSPMARVRMSCVALARLLYDHLDLETIVHFTTRDRNLMAIQSDLLGAHALGIHNVLALTGDPVRAGTYPRLTGVWDVDSIGLIRILQGMNAGHDAAGAAIGIHAGFYIGAALNLNSENEPIDVARERTRHKLPDPKGQRKRWSGKTTPYAQLTETTLELNRLDLKLAAGTQYIMTQPIYDLEPLERFVKTVGSVRVPLLLGMVPLHSSKHAEYLHNEVPGITISDEVRGRMQAAGEHGHEVGIELAHDVITTAWARGLIQGCYLMPSYGRYDLVGELARVLVQNAAVEQAVDSTSLSSPRKET